MNVKNPDRHLQYEKFYQKNQFFCCGSASSLSFVNCPNLLTIKQIFIGPIHTYVIIWIYLSAIKTLIGETSFHSIYSGMIFIRIVSKLFNL